jgi:hypothetical protein
MENWPFAGRKIDRRGRKLTDFSMTIPSKNRLEKLYQVVVSLLYVTINNFDENIDVSLTTMARQYCDNDDDLLLTAAPLRARALHSR